MFKMVPRTILFGVSATLLLSSIAGCSVKSLDRSFPRTGAVIPNATLQVGPSLGIPLEKIVYWGLYVGTAYLILDPLAPNWELEESRFADGYIYMALKMKRYYAGGAGEARAVLHRRAKSLVQSEGYAHYQIVEYTEGLESSVLGSQRVAEGVIRLIAVQPDQGSAPPARSATQSVAKPLS